MKMKEIKKEVEDILFVEVGSHDVHQLCTACLCATRTTHTLGDVRLKQYYMNILTETQVEEDEPILQSPRLCWECVAHLKRSVRFREQVQDSYSLLQTMRAKENLSEFLQTSMSRPARLSTCCAYSIDISPQDDDTQLMAADEDHDDKSAAMVYLEINMGVSTNRAEDQDASVDTDGLTGKRTEGAKHCVTTTNTTNSTDVETTCQSEGVFSCDGCSKRFPSKAALDRHIAIYQHITKTGPFPCDVCNKAFSTKGKFIMHQKVHSDKSYQCEVCSKSFHTPSKLLAHNRVHTGEKPFQCELCRKSFAQRVNLFGHIRSHTGEKPFQCKVCGKSFSQSAHLKTHMRSHTGEKPFQCKVCNKTFSHNCDLISHKRSHTGEKPFQCEVCQKQFTQSKSLKSHITLHTGERPFQCEVCPRQFSQRKYLTRHKKIHT